MRRPTIAQLTTGLAAAACLTFAALMLIVPRATNTIPLVVLTGSMTPTYAVGSLVYVETLPPDQVQVGDVITYQSKTTTNVISHRVVSIADDAGQPVFTTKGDANESIDSDAVTVDRYRGTVRFGIPYIGFVRDFAASPLGLTALALTAAAAFGIDRFRREPAGHEKVRRLGQRTVPADMSTADAPTGTADGWTHGPIIDFDEVPIGTIGAQQLLLLRVATNAIRRADLLRVIELLSGRVHSVANGQLVASFVGDRARLDDIESFISLEHHTLEAARSNAIRFDGVVAGASRAAPAPAGPPSGADEARARDTDTSIIGAPPPPPPFTGSAHFDRPSLESLTPVRTSA